MADKKTVVLAVDGSGKAKQALLWYLEQIHRPQNHLLLIYCVEPVTMMAEVPDEEYYTKSVESSKAHARKLEEKYIEILREHEVEGKFVALFSSRPGETIVSEATREKAGLIVTGTRGMGSVRRTLLGSVSDYVLHHAHCPVLICREPDMS